MYVVELEFLQNWVLVLLMHPLFRATGLASNHLYGSLAPQSSNEGVGNDPSNYYLQQYQDDDPHFSRLVRQSQAKVQFCNKLFVASASSLQAKQAEVASPRPQARRTRAYIRGVLCLHLAFTPYSHDDGSYSSRSPALLRPKSKLLCSR